MKIALGIEYNGHAYSGWQKQQNLSTVQGHIEKALSTIANESIQVICAGRTDAGVHATGQVIHFETSATRDTKAWTLGANTLLPPDISIRWAKEVESDFNARFTALSRRYRYIIHNYPVRSAILASRATWITHPLDAGSMHEAAQLLLGELDFSAFRSSQCESRTPMRNVQEITIKRHDHFIILEIQANAFLHHMVRNITGTLMKVGAGIKKSEWIQEVLLSKDRRLAAETAPATGLYLIKVQYPDKYQINATEKSVLFL